jgi:hypothetical protein
LKPNVLIAIPSPRDLPEFKSSVDSIKDIDKLWIKYCPAPITYPKIRDEFLDNPNNKKYTHLIICPDDLVIDREKLNLLISDYENLLNKDEQKTTVISGYCNVDNSDHDKDANICINPVTPRRLGRRYKWVKLNSIAAIKGSIERKRKDQRAQEDRMQAGQITITHYDETNPYEFQRQYLLPVSFAGFGMIMIPRPILQRIDLRNDSVAYPEKMNQGCCEDVMFCHNVLQKGYKLFVDIRAGFKHLKINDRLTRQLLLKKGMENTKPFLRYEYADEKQQTTKTLPIVIDDPKFLLLPPNKPKEADYIYGS